MQEGIRGGNWEHGLLMGVVSGAGGAFLSHHGRSLRKGGMIAANAILSGTVSELGGGKFANGAITGAFAVMFNDLMHNRKIYENHERMLCTAPLDVNVGMQNFSINVDAYVVELYDSKNRTLSLQVLLTSSNDRVIIGNIYGAFETELIIDGKIISTQNLKRHYQNYITPTNTNFTGEAYFNNIPTSRYNSIEVRVHGNWRISTGHGNQMVSNPTILGPFSTRKYNHIFKIK